MRWNARPPGFIASLAISAIFGLAPCLGLSQVAPPPSGAPAPKYRAVLTPSGPVPSTPVIMLKPRNLPPPPVIPVIGGVLSPLEAGTAPVLGEPYAAVQTTTILENNKILSRRITRLFRDTYGRTRVEQTLPTTNSTESSSTLISVTITDPVTAEQYRLEPQTKTAVVSRLRTPLAARIQPPVTPPTPTGVPPWGQPGVQESKPIPLGQKFIDGIAVVGTRVEDTITSTGQEPQTLVIDQWFSPELGLAILRTHQGGGIDSTQRLEHIVRAEPDPALFTVPRDYTRTEVPARFESANGLSHD